MYSGVYIYIYIYEEFLRYEYIHMDNDPSMARDGVNSRGPLQQCLLCTLLVLCCILTSDHCYVHHRELRWVLHHIFLGM